MRQRPKQGEIYKHFKGNCYRIVTLAEHSETGETLVIYQALYGDNRIYAKELSAFMSPVDRRKYPDTPQEMRFELLESGMAKPMGQESGNGEDLGGGGSSGSQKGPGDQSSSGERKTPGSGAETENRPASDEETPQIDPMLLAYLDADSCKEKLQILTSMKGRLTDKMINTMAIAIDVEIKPGDITERYEELKYCLATRERFECRRLR